MGVSGVVTTTVAGVGSSIVTRSSESAAAGVATKATRATTTTKAFILLNKGLGAADLGMTNYLNPLVSS
jgi:hypothetical protein